MNVFIDTSAIFALLDRDDDFHQQSKEIFFDLLKKDCNFHCTNYILVESFALLQNRLGLKAAKSFQESMIPLFKIFWIDNKIYDMAISNLVIAGKDISLVDYSSFLVIRYLGIDKVFTFDSHFAKQDFDVLTN